MRYPHYVLGLLLVLVSTSTVQGFGILDSIRSDTRESDSWSFGGGGSDHDHGHHRDDDDDGSFLGDLLGGIISGMLSGCSSSSSTYTTASREPAKEFFFPRFPYDKSDGYLMTSVWLPESQRTDLMEDYGGPSDLLPPRQKSRRWSARVRGDYADNFDTLSRMGGHLLFTTSSGWGFDTEMNFLEEDLPGGDPLSKKGHDQLWLGDGNIVYRFSENEYVLWRTGLGFNWLDDPIQTDFGFNFTLGLDVFPCKPWVISSTLDWGTIGHAGLFHFRTTVGVVVHGVEPYGGYEYYDIGDTQINSLIAGVRIWF